MDARDYMQVLVRQESDGITTLYLKDKRYNSLSVEVHNQISPNKALLHPDAKPPILSMPVTQTEVDATRDTQPAPEE